MKTPLICVPSQLDRKLRATIVDSIHRSMETLGEEEFLYIGERIEAKLLALHRSLTHWVRQLGTVASAFHSALEDESEGNCEMSSDVKRFVAVGLYYLINPFDIIPDHIPGDGYVDDALVLNYCASQIDIRAPGLLSRYVRKASRATMRPHVLE